MVHAEGVVAGTAAQHVDACAAFEAVVAGIRPSEQEYVIARATVKVVAAAAADDQVAAGTAGDGVVALSAVDLGNADQFGT